MNHSSAATRPIRRSIFLVGTVIGLIQLVLPLRSQLAAQTIRITEPVEWRDNRPTTVSAGQPVRVAGFVTHPGGVQRVLVNGEEAAFEADKDFPDSFHFERLLTPGTLRREIVVRIVPRTGQPFESKFELILPQPLPGRSDVQPRGPSSPWKPFRLRALGYGALAAAGLGVSMMTKSETVEVCGNGPAGFDCVNRTTTKPSNQAVGLALLGVGAAGLVIDALVTSGKAKSAGSQQGYLQPLPHVRFSVATVTSTMFQPRAELFRISVSK